MLNSLFLRPGKLIAGFAFMISPMALALPPGLLCNNHPAVQAVIAVQNCHRYLDATARSSRHGGERE